MIILHKGTHNPFASICYNPIPHLFFRACNVVTISKCRCCPTHLTFHESFDSKALPWWTSKQYPMARAAKLLPDVITAFRCKTTDPFFDFWATCSEQRLLIFTFLIVGLILGHLLGHLLWHLPETPSFIQTIAKSPKRSYEMLRLKPKSRRMREP